LNIANRQEFFGENHATLTYASPRALCMLNFSLAHQFLLKTLILIQDQGGFFSVQSKSVCTRYSAIAVIRSNHVPDPKSGEREKDPDDYPRRLWHFHQSLFPNKTN